MKFLKNTKKVWDEILFIFCLKTRNKKIKEKKLLITYFTYKIYDSKRDKYRYYWYYV